MDSELVTQWIVIFQKIPVIVYPIFIIILLLLVASAFISGSEVAFFSLTADQLEECKLSKKKPDLNILNLLEKQDLLLASILILNNFVNIAIVTLTTFATWEIVGKENEATITILITFIVTTAIVFLGEILPKIIANSYNISFARLMALSLKSTLTVTTPLAKLLITSGNYIEKKIGSKKIYKTSLLDLKKAVDITAKKAGKDALPDNQRDMLKGMLGFYVKNVKQIMQSRKTIVALDVQDSFKEVLQTISTSGYSRIPIYEKSIDHIIGLLYAKDLVYYIHQEAKDFNWVKIIKKYPLFIPADKKISELFREFQNGDNIVHIAIVKDEYGGTEGLVTMEDVIEELLGEINDEFDNEDSIYNKVKENNYIFKADISLNDLSKELKVESEIFNEIKGESESLGGLLLQINKAIPKIGDKIVFQNFDFTINDTDEKSIKTVHIKINEIE